VTTSNTPPKRYTLTIPLDGGRFISVDLDKPAHELTLLERFEIVEALKRQVAKRGQA
jgi:hypothetical protein